MNDLFADSLVLDEIYDPLSEADFAEGVEDIDREAHQNEVVEFAPHIGSPAPDDFPVEKEDDRPAAVRIEALFEQMKHRRSIMIEILDMCRQPQNATDVFNRVDEAQSCNISVFDGAALCNLLTRTGALTRTEPIPQAPIEVEEAGDKYLEPAPFVTVQYQTTPEGVAFMEADKPLESIKEMIEREPQYKPIFLRILVACLDEKGKSAKELGELVDNDPLLQEPRRWAAYFFESLKECGALTWNKTWITTEAGKLCIELLSGSAVSH